VNLERLGSITSELSSSLLKSIVVPPGGLRGWFVRHRSPAQRSRNGRSEGRSENELDVSVAEYPAGPIILMGGLPAPDEAVVEALHLAGGRSARLAIIPAAASGDPEAAAAAGVRIFTRYGMKRVERFLLDTREKATDPAWVARLREFEAVVLCGDSPARGLQVLQWTPAAAALREHVEEGRLLVGVDAGAALLGSRLFPHVAEEAVAAGLGLLPGLLVDTAFTQSQRFGRLVRAMSAEEAAVMLGVGLDAGAALVVVDGEAKMLGETTITFVDPRERVAAGGDQPSGLKVHLLTDGYRMNLRMRRAIPPERGEAAGK
jgi:cyanophycinase